MTFLVDRGGGWLAEAAGMAAAAVGRIPGGRDRWLPQLVKDPWVGEINAAAGK